MHAIFARSVHFSEQIFPLKNFERKIEAKIRKENETHGCAAFALSDRFYCGYSACGGYESGLTDTVTVSSAPVHIAQLKLTLLTNK